MKLIYSYMIIAVLSICALFLLFSNIRYFSNLVIAIFGADIFLIMLAFSDLKTLGSVIYIHYNIDDLGASNYANKNENLDRMTKVFEVVKKRWVYDKNYRIGKNKKDLIKFNKLVDLDNISEYTKNSNIIIMNWRELYKLDYALNSCYKNNSIIQLRSLNNNINVIRCWD